MQYREIRAARMIALLADLGIKSAKDMTIVDACRSYRRMRRGMESTHKPMGAAMLADRSRKLRRARQTHPGKR